MSDLIAVLELDEEDLSILMYCLEQVGMDRKFHCPECEHIASQIWEEMHLARETIRESINRPTHEAPNATQ